jgi:RHS repeat-associated protein
MSHKHGIDRTQSILFPSVEDDYASNGTNTYYINNPAGQTEVVQKGTANSNYTYNIVGNDNLGQITVASSTINRYYYLKDHLGDIKMIVNSSGGVDSWNDYYPFGMQMGGRNGSTSADGRYKYISVEQDAETGYLATGQRWYDPRIGLFRMKDPLNQYPSPYTYCGNNPITLADPTGMYGTTHYTVDGTDISSDMYNDVFAEHVQNFEMNQQHQQSEQQLGQYNEKVDGNSQTTNPLLKQYVQPCSTSVGTPKNTSSQPNNNLLQSFILPAVATGVEVASDAHDAATLATTVIEVSKATKLLLKSTESIGYIAPAVTTYTTIMDYKSGEISKNQMILNLSGAAGTVIATAYSSVAGASAGTAVFGLGVGGEIMKYSGIWCAPTGALRENVMPLP